jgi:hypothetical protein
MPKPSQARRKTDSKAHLRSETPTRPAQRADARVSLSRIDELNAIVTELVLRVSPVFMGADLTPSERNLVFKALIARLTPGADPRAGVITDLAPSTLPSRPPENWQDRDPAGNESPAAFTRRVYATWIGRGLTRPMLYALDPALYKALSVWEARHPEERIAELPTRSEVIDAEIAQLLPNISPDDLSRLASALRKRNRSVK